MVKKWPCGVVGSTWIVPADLYSVIGCAPVVQSGGPPPKERVCSTSYIGVTRPVVEYEIGKLGGVASSGPHAFNQIGRLDCGNCALEAGMTVAKGDALKGS